jgi:hypothetical protein
VFPENLEVEDPILSTMITEAHLFIIDARRKLQYNTIFSVLYKSSVLLKNDFIMY